MSHEHRREAPCREGANEWYDSTLYSRLNDKAKSAIVLVMHRLHEDDLAGHVLAREDWEVLRFPAIAEADERHRIEFGGTTAPAGPAITCRGPISGHRRGSRAGRVW